MGVAQHGLEVVAAVVAVIANRADAAGLVFAAQRGINTAVVSHKGFARREEFDDALAEAVEDALIIPYAELPGFPVPKISGHAGKLFVGHLGGKPVAVLAGRAHPYESGNAAVMRPAIEMLKGAGIDTLILTNAAGSLKPEMRPGSIMLIADHINYSGMNPLIGQHGDENFVPMTDAYDPALRKRFHAAAREEGITLHEGVYCWYSGPSFETPAEIRMFQIIGGTAVGMSTVPEVILGRFLGLHDFERRQLVVKSIPRG